jgi:hypothetical protein
MSQWVLEGLTVTGLYLDDIPVQGVVSLSRVKYGGEVSHHVQLDKPIEVYGALRDTVILDHKQIQTVKG